MPSYTVIRNYMCSDTYTIDADTPEQAKQLVLEGKGEHLRTDHDDHDTSVDVELDLCPEPSNVPMYEIYMQGLFEKEKENANL